MKLSAEGLVQARCAVCKHIDDLGRGIGAYGHDSSLMRADLKSRIEPLQVSLDVLEALLEELEKEES